jgi:hypothetical protein
MPPTGKEKVRKRPQFTKMHCSQSPPQAQETPVAAAYWIDLGTRQPSITYRSHVSLGQRAREFLPSPAPCKYPIPKSSPQPQNRPTALLNKPTKPTRKTTPPSPSKSAHGASKSVYCPRALLTSSKTSSFSNATAPSAASAAGSIATKATHSPHETTSRNLVSCTDGHERSVGWMSLVIACTRRSIKYRKDRLPSLSGIAKRLQQYGFGEYLGGIWRNGLPAQLLWTVDDFGMSQRARTTYAPSWSIENSTFSFGFSEDASIRPVPLAQTDDVKCTSSSQDPTGNLDGGYVTITGPTVSLHLMKQAGRKRRVSPIDQLCGQIAFRLTRQEHDEMMGTLDRTSWSSIRRSSPKPSRMKHYD